MLIFSHVPFVAEVSPTMTERLLHNSTVCYRKKWGKKEQKKKHALLVGSTEKYRASLPVAQRCQLGKSLN